jgi:methyl-accepting chemotaxis protein
MKHALTSLKTVLSLGLSLVLVLVCAGLYFSQSQLNRQSAADAAMVRQMMSLRVLIDKFSEHFPEISTQYDSSGAVTRVTWDALPELPNHDLIDRVGQVSGETATLFGWDAQQGDFLRLTTNIIKPDGTRAVGTWLGTSNPVHTAMLQRQTFFGDATILGKDYYTIYQPILDAAGQTVGVFYVGVDRSDVAAEMADRQITTLLFALIALIAGVAVVLALVSWVLKPLREISDRLVAMNDGDLETDVPHTGRVDALGTTAQIVAAFKDKLRHAQDVEQENQWRRDQQDKTVAALRCGISELAKHNLTTRVDLTDVSAEYHELGKDFDDGVGNLAQALADADLVATNVRAAAVEIGTTSDDPARRVETQAATLVESAEALNQLTVTGQEIAADVETADTLATESRKLTNESEQVVNSAINAIERIEAASEKINQIITAIDDIAFQTNLLALNAGVEAARAGSAGKGFAVVASEVRGLAQTAAASAQEIKTLITASNDEVQTGAELVQKTGTSLNEVQTQVERLVKLISNVAGAIRSQTKGLSEINEGVQQLEGTTQHNAAVVEQLNAAGQGLSGDAERLTETLSKFEIGDARQEARGRIEQPAGVGQSAPIDPGSQITLWDDDLTSDPNAVEIEAREISDPAPFSSVPETGKWASF